MHLFLIIHEFCIRINSYATILYYKLIYPGNIHTAGKYYFRRRLIIVAEGKVEIGDHVFFNNSCSINSMESVVIGDHSIFGENVRIYDHNHVYDASQYYSETGFTTSPVKIGKKCWIGSNCTILKGVTIGDNCIIGAGVVVFKDVPPNTRVICKQNLEFSPNN